MEVNRTDPSRSVRLPCLGKLRTYLGQQVGGISVAFKTFRKWLSACARSLQGSLDQVGSLLLGPPSYSVYTAFC